MKLRWLLTAAFEILTENFKILIDPWISRPPNAPWQLKTKIKDIQNFDAIFLSHGHFDHSLDVPEIVKNTETKVYCSKQIRKVFIKEFNMEEENLIELSPGQIIEFEPDLKVTIIRSQHIQFDDFAQSRGALLRNANFDAATKQMFAEIGKYVMGDVFGFLMEFSHGKKLIHFGSGGYHKGEIEKLPQEIDIFLAPVAGREDADIVIAQMANIFTPKMIIPHHYDDFFPPLTWMAYRNFEDEVREVNSNIIINKLKHETYFEF
jgi:L-ascorbate metabolism protein UlaG (beta-lactamase superfamily)